MTGVEASATRTAACSCGRLSLTVAGDPSYFGACSCRDCQKTTGSVFSMSAYFPKAAVAPVAGEHSVHRRTSAAGRWLEFHFCPHCGSTVFWHAEFDPDSIGIAVGNFDDPAFGPPQYAVWSERRQPWVQFPPTCREYPQGPDL